AGLLGHLAHRCLLEGLLVLDVTLGQAPFDPAGAVATGDDRDACDSLMNVDDDPAGRDLFHRRQPAWQPGRPRSTGSHPVTVTRRTGSPVEAQAFVAQA